MLKQTFDLNSITKILTTEDIWRWNIWGKPEEKENAIESLVTSIQAKNFNISPLKCEIRRGKPTYQASNIEDVILIRLLDRYIRCIYKVRQSDRNRIIRQVSTVLRDSGDYSVMRLDIKECYESMDFNASIRKLGDDMILAPSCMQLLSSISTYCRNMSIKGLPRGLAISPTLAELYLEPIDKYIKGEEGVIYATRYVDDFFILVEKNKVDKLKDNLKLKLSNIGLSLNEQQHKQYIGSSQSAIFDYLGYNISIVNNAAIPDKTDYLLINKKIL